MTIEHTFTIKNLREKIITELDNEGIRNGDDLPVEVWSKNGVAEYAIVDVVFDDGVISIEVEPRG